ncbi:ricin-type beta-trefoil lectin domain protein [Amycolatopsis sp. NBC_01488]|uniref:RICIN domain-containing protein n=1 Tax=Amycolatopsis sp. NBC_01488 TaxID=2903563 RepID=UPI002E2A4460|nr:ricin-type beta-trefoil lectin domain protein [Amycolatopsis sp. NBC_01488]
MDSSRPAGRCVDAGGGTDGGTPVGLRPCDGSLAQQWVARDDGSLIGAASGRCLTASGPSARASLSLQDCTAGSGSTQGWQLPAQRGLVGEVTGPGGRCLDVPGNDPTQDSVFLYDCNRSPAQQWVSVGDGTLRVDGKCLDSGGNPQTGVDAPGIGVPQLPCSGASTQQWVAQPGGALVNPVSGLCLAALSGDLHAGVVVDTCSGGAMQQWHLAAQTQVRGQLVGIGGKCVDSDVADNATVHLWDCDQTAPQFFNTNGDGTFQAQGKCLDTGATAPGSGVIKNPCSGSSTQQWDVQPNGYLVNVGAGNVLDDQFGSTANGNALQIWSVNGGPQQKWSTPLRAHLAGS